MTKETLDGKIALVTDAGQNIGRGITLRLAHAGVTIVFNGRSNRPAVKKIKSERARQGFHCRLLRPSGGIVHAEEVRLEFVGCDIQVNNAE